MELDKRIKKGKRPLTCLDIEQAREFVGKECIFSDKYENFKNLDKYLFDNSDYSAILSIDDYTRNGDYVFRNAKNGVHYGLILPLEWAKEPEKKWRAYTIAEFQETFTIGRAVRFRRKEAPTREHLLAFNGYYTLNDGSVAIVFGSMSFALEHLFEQYEWQEFYTEDYRPFGIEE